MRDRSPADPASPSDVRAARAAPATRVASVVTTPLTWAAFGAVYGTVITSDAPVNERLLRYAGSAWSEATPQLRVHDGCQVSFGASSLLPNDDLWAGAAVYHTQDNGPRPATISPLLCILRHGDWSPTTSVGGK